MCGRDGNSPRSDHHLDRLQAELDEARAEIAILRARNSSSSRPAINAATTAQSADIPRTTDDLLLASDAIRHQLEETVTALRSECKTREEQLAQREQAGQKADEDLATLKMKLGELVKRHVSLGVDYDSVSMRVATEVGGGWGVAEGRMCRLRSFSSMGRGGWWVAKPSADGGLSRLIQFDPNLVKLGFEGGA